LEKLFFAKWDGWVYSIGGLGGILNMLLNSFKNFEKKKVEK
jgi:hypothetical protein